MSGTPALRRSPRHGRIVALVVSTTLAGLAACTSGHASTRASSPVATSGGAGSPVALSTAIPGLPATPPATAAALAGLMSRGVAATGYARIDFTTALSGNTLAGNGRIRLDAGQVTSLDVRAAVSKIGGVHYLLVDSVPYAALPKPTAPGKAFVVLGGAAGSDELTRAAIGLQATKLLAAPATYRTLVLASDSLRLLGRASVGATPALHYRGPVTIDKISSGDPVRLALGALGVTKLTLELWVDGLGRPLKASAAAPDGRPSNVTFSAINGPFTVAKPPAGEVDGG